MQSMLSNLGLGFWRLVPANPIVLRVVQTGSKRPHHFWVRLGYLLILLLVMIFAQMSHSSSVTTNSLGSQAKQASNIFTLVSMIQLALMCFLAPVFAAGAISQEKDAETFNVLLTTPLTNAQIVLGSLLSRLFFVLILLLSGLPIFCITMLYGGVTREEIFASFGIAACTAVFTGALAITISVIRVGTRGTVFSFYVGIAMYLLIGLGLGLLPATHVAESIPPAGKTGMSWLAPFHPFLSLAVVQNLTPAPAASAVQHYLWPLNRMIAHPAEAYMTLTLILSLAMTSFATLFVRRGAKQGEATFITRVFRNPLRKRRATPQTRRARRVWANPVAWREAATHGSAASSRLVWYGYLLLGTIGGIVFILARTSGMFEPPGSAATMTPAGAENARHWLTGIVMIEFLTVVLMAINSAATAITRERDAGTMELLLTTPLTSKYIIWGKLRGLISFTIPLMAVPTLTVIASFLTDLIMGHPKTVTLLSAILVGPLLLVYSSVVCMMGLHLSLKSRKSMQAVLTSVGILTVVGFGLGMCAFGALQGAHELGAILAPLTFVTGVFMVLNPSEIARSLPGSASYQTIQGAMAIGTLIAIAVYGAVVAGLYRTMVRDFDMIVRKQSR